MPTKSKKPPMYVEGQTKYDWSPDSRPTYRYLDCVTNRSKGTLGILIMPRSDTFKTLGERGYLTGKALEDFNKGLYV